MGNSPIRLLNQSTNINYKILETLEIILIAQELFSKM